MRQGNRRMNEAGLVIVGAPQDVEGLNDARVYAPAESDPKEIIVNHIKHLEYYEARTKEIHWSCDNDKTHILCDALRDEIVEYQDAIAEVYMGYTGTKLQIGTLMLQGAVSCMTLPELCNAMIREICTVIEAVQDDVELRGIKRKCEEMVGYLDTVLYKETQK